MVNIPIDLRYSSGLWIYLCGMVDLRCVVMSEIFFPVYETGQIAWYSYRPMEKKHDSHGTFWVRGMVLWNKRFTTYSHCISLYPISRYISLYIVISCYISLYIVIYRYLSLYIVIYRYISLYIVIYRYIPMPWKILYRSCPWYEDTKQHMRIFTQACSKRPIIAIFWAKSATFGGALQMSGGICTEKLAKIEQIWTDQRNMSVTDQW